MEYVHLGRTGLLGEPAVPRNDELRMGRDRNRRGGAFTIMDRALELGINFFDTANVYGWREGGRSGEGITEQIIGRWFAQGGGRRDRVVLATKVFGRTGDWPNESLLSALNIRRACDESLRRLQTDHIDLYQFHHVDRDARGTRSGRRWRRSSRPARSCTSAAATSPAGTSPRPTRRLVTGISSGWCLSNASTT